jgi:Na+/proline symporter
MCLRQEAAELEGDDQEGHWPAHWPEMKCYDPTARMTMFGSMLATFTWFICTSVSDQIAVQRCLATRDAKAAETVLYITLGSETVIATVLACLGLGLLAAQPHYCGTTFPVGLYGCPSLSDLP